MTNDIWIIATAALVAASCALVGVFLILRRQALIGDAISHVSTLRNRIGLYHYRQSSTPHYARRCRHYRLIDRLVE